MSLYSTTSLKTCFKCGVAKPRAEFYKHPMMKDGLLGKCKSCTKNDVRENYARTRKEKHAYDRERNKLPDRKASRYKNKIANIRKNPRARIAHRAHNAVAIALKSGRLIRQPCCLCGNINVQAHHDDYSKPLEVRWLCFKCHREQMHGQVVTCQKF